MSVHTRAALFCNTKSRRGRQWFGAAKDLLEAGGIELVEAKAFRDPAEISPSVERAIKDERLPLVVLGGGDGTFSANARHFVGSDATLGVLPFGTGNALARDLGIASSPEAACEAILKGEERTIDLGTIGEDYFVNVVTVGLTTRIAENLTIESKKSLGRLAYAIALLKAIPAARPFRAKLTSDSGCFDLETLQVVIGSGRHHAGPFPITPDASIADGKLDIYALASASKLALLKLALNLPGAHHVEMREVTTLSSAGGLLETTPIQKVNVDGELSTRTPIKFGIAAAALRVMAPKP